jgi:alkylation response protein AidB-like acyl-CoA dehydrogenase
MLLEDAGELAEGVRAAIAAEFDSLALHAFIDSAWLRVPALQTTARNLGCFSLALPERLGGLGLGPAEMAPIYAVLGEFMPPLAVTSTALATDLLDAAGAEAWLSRIADGATLAVALPPFERLPELRSSGAGLACTGELPFLLDGADAEMLLFQGRSVGGPVWIACRSDAPGVSVAPVGLVDETRSAARVALSNVELQSEAIIARGEAVRRLEGRLAHHAALAFAADSVGGSAAILRKTLEYLRVREQFSRPIGSFQALKHRATNLYLRMAKARALLDEATGAMNGEGACELALLAFAYGADAYAAIAEDALQLHGGIGFTRDHDAHVHLKRAKLNQALLGGTDRARDMAGGVAERSWA